MTSKRGGMIQKRESKRSWVTAFERKKEGVGKKVNDWPRGGTGQDTPQKRLDYTG